MRFWLLRKLLHWYSTRELDQWDMWKMDTEYGMVYITISRSPEPGSDIHYEKI